MNDVIVLLASLLAPTLVPVPDVPAVPEAPRCRVNMLSVQYPLPEGKGKGLGLIKEHVTIGLLVVAPKRQIIGVDPIKSVVRRLEDDRGTKLLTAEHAQWISSVVRPGKDETTQLFIQGDAIPARGAVTIHVDADLVLRCGSGRQINVADHFKLEAGKRGTLGHAELEVKEIDGRVVLMISSPEKIVKRIEAKDQKGRSLVPRYGSGLVKDGQVLDRKGFIAQPGATEVNVLIESFETFERVTLPLRLEVNLSGATEKGR